MNRRRQSKGFTLIELLVVIAIIALLISILLPALGRARKAGQMAVSMSNIRQMGVGMGTYRDSNKNRVPLFVLRKDRGYTVNPNDPDAYAWATWSFGGKNNIMSTSTAQAAYKGANSFADVMAADRPMNPYVYETINWEAPEPPAKLSYTATARLMEAKVFKDPSDKIGHQQNWPVANKDGLSCYDDVGTSYQYNAKWWDQVDGKFGGGTKGFVLAYEFGIKRLSLADTFNPSKFSWVHDEYADITVNRPMTTARVINGYDDINKSILGFLDGHGAYVVIYPGKQPISYTNDKYSFVFEDLKIPT